MSNLANRVKNPKPKKKKKTQVSLLIGYMIRRHLICVVTSLKTTVLALEWAVAELRVYDCSEDVVFEMFSRGTNLTRL